jgi:asparagine synthase (glutamine-hydrolysing)
MCGITGIYSYKDEVEKEDIQRMTNTLQHRGPDAEGIYVSKNIALGHRRLSILDLSSNGNQPMTSHNNRYVMVYNGEVYNYREIAAEIQENSQNGVNFSSSSDSEVILEAFSLWGVSFLEKLNGMFSIAIYDTKDNTLFLFRDRLGIKPLYYSINAKGVCFGSELKSIVSVTKDLKINLHAIKQYLRLGFIPAPLSIYQDIAKLEPGHYLKIENNAIEKANYWSATNQIKENTITSEKEAIVKISDLLASSVQYQLKSDVPFGVFLSGGIDSSLVTAQAAAISSTSVNTFSIGFTENKFNESEHAKKVAHILNTNHHEFIVSEKDAIELIDSIIDVYDEPFADSSAIPTMLVSKLAKSSVTVTLSGEGGDELFMGYGAHVWAKRLNNPFIYHSRDLIKKILLKQSSNKYKRAALMFNFLSEDNLQEHIFSQEQYNFSSNEIDRMLTTPCNYTDLTSIPFKSLARELNAMEKQALWDLLYYLPGDLLTKVDRASMKYSLETRVPYLDHRIVELALNIAPELKYKNGVSKYILKEILYQYLPKQLFERPKQGFAIPLSKWLKKDLYYLIENYLNEAIIEQFNIVKYSEVKILLNRYLKGEDYLYNRIWLLIILHKFLAKIEQ